MLQSIDKKNRIFIYLLILIILSTTNHKSIEPKKSFNRINKIKVSGLSENNNIKITEKLKQSLSKNIFFLKSENINRIISQFNLVESYTVKKVYPSEIKIEIEQTKFIAKISDNKNFLVGSNGKLIENENYNKSLPFLFGEFNSEKFLKFKKIIENSKFKFSDFKSIFFYKYDRWDILTNDNILIKLPEKDLKKTLEIAHKIISNNLFKDIKIIDLRIENHVITKK
mgnify:FL=1